MPPSDLKDGGVVIPIQFAYLACAKTGGRWRMAADYPKCRPGGESNAAVVPDVVSQLEHINTSLGTWYAAVDLPFFSIPVHEAHQKELFSAGKASNGPSLSCHRGLSARRPYSII